MGGILDVGVAVQPLSQRKIKRVGVAVQLSPQRIVKLPPKSIYFSSSHAEAWEQGNMTIRKIRQTGMSVLLILISQKYRRLFLRRPILLWLPAARGDVAVLRDARPDRNRL